MKRKIRLTESELINLIHKIIKEEKETQDHLKYTHPRFEELELDNDGECQIRVARNKHNDKFSPILVCSRYGKDLISAELPLRTKTKESIIKFICDHIEKTYQILDNMLDHNYDPDSISESTENSRWEIIGDPIVCDLDLF